MVNVLSLEEVRGEFDDFQESSRELEAELEAQLEQAEAVNKDLLSRVQRVEEENESVKVSKAINVAAVVLRVFLTSLEQVGDPKE